MTIFHCSKVIHGPPERQFLRHKPYVEEPVAINDAIIIRLQRMMRISPWRLMRPELERGKLLMTVLKATLFILLLTIMPQFAFSQGTGGSIQGRVTEESGAAVPGASVDARQTVTGSSRTVTTDADGSYRISELRVGPYEITVTLSGFTKQTRSGVNLVIGQQAP